MGYRPRDRKESDTTEHTSTHARFVTAFLSRSKRLLISWLQSLSAVISEPKKILSLLPLFPLLFAMKACDQMP